MSCAAAETPATVAKRLTDLLLSFPSAATGGVAWQTLVSKYNERHTTTLDVASLGHSSPLAAASALLFDVVRFTDKRNVQNPVVAIDDCVAMTAQPGAAATWPSLYKALCDIASSNGFQSEEEVADDETAHAILVSQLKPLLQQHWHSEFDECNLSYLAEQGKAVRVKKMKHLLQALVQWREQRDSCPGKRTELDEALVPRLEVVPSKKHHDLLLRCVVPKSCPPVICRPAEYESTMSTASDESTAAAECESTSGLSIGSAELMQEIEKLRAENACLRNKNTILEQQVQGDVVQEVNKSSFAERPVSLRRDLSNFSIDEELEEIEHDVLEKDIFEIPPELMMNVFDNPSEPPPYEYCGSGSLPSRSTAVPSNMNFGSNGGTPLTMASGSHAQSVAMTPTTTSTWVWDGQKGQVCSVVPMWYVIGDRGLHNVPSGVVQQGITIFEKDEGEQSLPSFFTMGTREF